MTLWAPWKCPLDKTGAGVIEAFARQIPHLFAAYGTVTVVALILFAVAFRNVTATSRWRFGRHRHDGATVLLLSMSAFMIMPVLAKEIFDQSPWRGHDLEQRFALALSAVLFIAVFISYLRVNDMPIMPRKGELIPQIATGIKGFLVLTLPVLIVHVLAGFVLILGGGAPDTHPLGTLHADRPLEVMLLVGSACLLAPLVEEIVFRKLILNWCLARVEHSILVAMLAAVMLLAHRGIFELNAMFYLLDAAVIMLIAVEGRTLKPRWPRRTAAAIVAQAILFAVMHASVWPTPWPLLLLGIGLGVIAARSGSIVPTVIAHSLFNSVSIVYILSGGTV
jgi:membrane protease YdiL (CAAX protease family)